MKKLSASIFFLFSYLFFAPSAFAQGTTTVNLCNVGIFSALCNLNSGNFGSIIGTIINLIFVIAIIIAVLYFIWGGVKWVMSRGEKEQVEAARNQIVASVVGLIVIFLAFFIINIVLGFFVPNANINNLKLPTIGTQFDCATDTKYACRERVIEEGQFVCSSGTHNSSGDFSCQTKVGGSTLCCTK